MKKQIAFVLISLFFSINSNCQNHTDFKYNWDFSDIYLDWNEWQKDLYLLDSISPEYYEFRGKLAESSDYLFKFKKFDDQLLQLQDKLFFYVSLIGDLNSRNPVYASKLSELQSVMIKTESRKNWVESELSQVSKEKVFSFINENPDLLVYKHQFEKFYNQLDFVTDEKSKRIASYYSKAANASSNIFKALSSSDMIYNTVILSDETVVKTNPSQVSKICATNQDQDDRRIAFEALEESYTKNKHSYAEIWIGIAQSRWANAQLHGYESCLDAVLQPENISKEIYLNLLEIAGENTELLYKYRKLRKRVLGIETYYESDELIDLSENKKEYKYDSVLNIVYEALTPMGEDYIRQLKLIFQGGKIDVYEKPGKFIGAYNWSKYRLPPFLLLNWKNTRDDVFVLVHESGHAMHSILSDNSQAFCNAYYSPMIAETAALFNEMLLLDYMLKTSKNNNEKIILLVKAIDNLSRAFYRQSQFAEFEYCLYGLIERNEPISAEIMANMFLKIDKKYNGDIMQRSDNYPFSWTKIHHFCNSYYYVYNYAVSYAVSSFILDQIAIANNKNEKNLVINKYLDLLKSGGSDYPVELIRKVGVDLTSKDSFLAVIKRFEKLLKQLEEALREENKI